MDHASFFNLIRKTIFSAGLRQSQVDGINALLLACERQGITDARWVANILAQVHHETGGTMMPESENLTYTTAARLCQVWPKRFPTIASATPYVRNPEALAINVYGDRLGNRTGTRDGWLYRGQGQIQPTGRDHFVRFGNLLGVDLVGSPELAMELGTSASIAVVGMVRGLFTGRGLEDFFSTTRNDPKGARAIVNGDVAANGAKVAALHASFLKAIEGAGGWAAARDPVAEWLASAPAPVDRIRAWLEAAPAGASL